MCHLWQQKMFMIEQKRFMIEQEAKGLLSNLEIRPPLNKIPLLGDLLF